MTQQQEKRIAIAEACGWTPDPFGYYVKDPAGLAGPRYRIDDLPDYLNDLNAMHEAEKMLDDDQWLEYMLNLLDKMHKHADRGKWTVCRDCMSSAAAQRAEAFGMTLKLW